MALWRNRRRAVVGISVASIAVVLLWLGIIVSSSSSGPKHMAAAEVPLQTSVSTSTSSLTPSSSEPPTSETTSTTTSTTTVNSPPPPSAPAAHAAAKPAPAPTNSIPTQYRNTMLLVAKYAGWDGWVDYVDPAGYRHHVPDPKVRDCLERVGPLGEPITVSQGTLESYPASDITARCPYPVGSFLRQHEDGWVWVIDWADDKHTNVVRRHAGGTCEQYGRSITEIPRGETEGYDRGGDFWPSQAACQNLPNPR